MMTGSFSPDLKIAKIAEAYAEDACDLAAASFGTKLDWTDASIENVEAILSHLRASMPMPRPPDDVIWNFAKGFGSYLGEVFRRNHGAEWGMITDGARAYPGMRLRSELLFWPWGRVYKRLVEGDESNVWRYYGWLLVESKSAPPAF